jgi:hypothetical protein
MLSSPSPAAIAHNRCPCAQCKEVQSQTSIAYVIREVTIKRALSVECHLESHVRLSLKQCCAIFSRRDFCQITCSMSRAISQSLLHASLIDRLASLSPKNKREKRVASPKNSRVMFGPKGVPLRIEEEITKNHNLFGPTKRVSLLVFHFRLVCLLHSDRTSQSSDLLLFVSVSWFLFASLSTSLYLPPMLLCMS